MANTQAQFGFAQYGYLPGGAPDYQLSKYAIQSTYASAIFFGDVVQKSASLGPYIQQCKSGSSVATGVLGIFQGCQYTPVGGAPQWFPWYPPTAGGADAVAYVIDAPNAMFRAAALLTAIPATAIGNNIGFSTGAGGTTLGGGFSTYTVDFASIASTVGLPFKIIKLYDGVGNGSDPTTSFNWVIVGFNNTLNRQGNTGIL